MSGLRESFWVHCPHCGEGQEVVVEADVHGAWIEDCQVCCRPWRVEVTRDRCGDAELSIEPAD